ncbi:hypothetical protein AB0D00_26440 [Streptomyces sp. NPDC048213]|uniref:hypothetical protein n=1 Tax=Streptomyces sp. NPDC048213 TaxID=3160984 RepID=UPI0033D2F4FB
MTADQPPVEPILSTVRPVTDSPYAEGPYEAALSELRAAVAQVSAAIPGTTGETASRLSEQRSMLNRAQQELRPGDTDALTRAHELCLRVRQQLPGRPE